MISRILGGGIVVAAFLVGAFLVWVAVYTMLYSPPKPDYPPIPAEVTRQIMADSLATREAGL